MLINKLDIELECFYMHTPCKVSIKDRRNVVIAEVVFDTSTIQTVSFELPFPTTLMIDIMIADGNSVNLKGMILSGLALPRKILDQICNFKAKHTGQVIVTRIWNQSGTVSIDFFAQDWIQYHLLYGNRINKQ